MSQNTGDPNKPAARVAAPTAAAIADEDLPFEADPTPAAAPAADAGESSSRAQDILAMIRNRKQ
jgi:hypothetical protein